MPSDEPPQHEVPEHLLEYRKVLVIAEQKAQEDFDKTVLSLSGGALGVSFVFLKDVIGTSPVVWPSSLIAAWVAWGVSSLAVLVSYQMSVLTIRQCIRDIDACVNGRVKFSSPYAAWTSRLNAIGAVMFFAGVICITWFAAVNISSKVASNAKPPVASSASPAPPASVPAPTRAETIAPGTAPAASK